MTKRTPRLAREIAADLRSTAGQLYQRSVERVGLPADCREVVTADDAAVLALRLWSVAEDIERLLPLPLRRREPRGWFNRLLDRLALATKAPRV